MGMFTPEFDGQITVERLPDDFAARIQRRVEEGLFVPGRRDRANYKVTSRDQNTVSFVAEGLATVYNVGLNEVTVRRGGRNQVQYHVEYRGWTKLAVAHGGLIGLVFVAAYTLLPALRANIASYPHGLLWTGLLMGFFCLAWPWILTAIHRGAAERALQHVLEETLSDPSDDRATAA